MSQAYQAFKQITPDDIKSFSLQEALKKVGLSQGMSKQQLQECKWQVFWLKQRIETLQKETLRLQRQKQNEIDRLQRQNETLRLQRQKQNEVNRLQRQLETVKAQQQITKLQEKNQNLQERISNYEALPNGRQQAITRREQAITRREQAITRRESAITQREQAIKLQEAPFYLKGQFLVGYIFVLIGIGISLALGWKKKGEPGYQGLMAGLIIGAFFAAIWIGLVISIGCIKWSERKAKKAQIAQIAQRKQGPQIIQREQESSIAFRALR